MVAEQGEGVGREKEMKSGRNAQALIPLLVLVFKFSGGYMGAYYDFLYAFTKDKYFIIFEMVKVNWMRIG